MLRFRRTKKAFRIVDVVSVTLNVKYSDNEYDLIIYKLRETVTRWLVRPVIWQNAKIIFHEARVTDQKHKCKHRSKNMDEGDQNRVIYVRL